MNPYFSENGSGAAVILGFVAFLILITVIFLAMGRARFFKGCGQDKTAAYIPFYSNYVFMTKICRLPVYWFIAQTFCILWFWFFSNPSNPFPFIFLCVIQSVAFINLNQLTHKKGIKDVLLGGIFYWFVMAYYGYTSCFIYDKEVVLKKM